MLAPMLRLRPARRSRGAGHLVAAPVLALALVLAACGSSGSSTTASPAASAATTASSATSAAADGYPAGCHAVPVPTPKGPQHLSPPILKLNPAHSYTVALVTNCGTIDISLAVKEAPKTTASFASLVARGFYNDLTFHRIVPEFVIQGGDPLGTGEGGPGYEIVEAPPPSLTYTVGTVAMAKTEAEPSGASGSQFFIVSGSQGATLPAQYALVGHVTEGLNVVETIQKVPTSSSGDGFPDVPVVISAATLTMH